MMDEFQTQVKPSTKAPTEQPMGVVIPFRRVKALRRRRASNTHMSRRDRVFLTLFLSLTCLLFVIV
ncbi:hypothetical protein LLE49_27445 [Alicyclobacillus tolerans]|uniref:hypothetical protein n=1 Tax=Alicyclobacillus tolerans TaxID=90970 RepID=UPI001F195638|nr:hypothetical protein [Alicyclobacillus tolerans]MCF8568457.1 hypothetical protein [Alicyclobacillus tolerans]